jgi:hypothetical protein
MTLDRKRLSVLPESSALAFTHFAFPLGVTSMTSPVDLMGDSNSLSCWQPLVSGSLRRITMNDRDAMDRRRRRAELRAAVLRLGGLLGWGSREAIAFAEAVTNRPWRRCGCTEFETVLEEYWAIGRVIQEKRARSEREEDTRVAAQ